ncbi:MAG: vitamin B12 dependent-methionine synthase activation domain-containing protein, partial [Clostridium sp.]
DKKYGEEAKRLFDEANEMLDKLNEIKIKPEGVYGIFEAYSNEGEIVLRHNNREFEFLTLRQEKENKEGVYLSISDFIAPKESDLKDYVGAFIVTSGKEIEELAESYKRDGDEYSSIMVKVLGDRLAEAYAEYLHYRYRKEFYGYAPTEELEFKALFKGEYTGIRPAIGYPSLPDHSEKLKLFELLNAKENISVELTDNYLMKPVGSVCGIYLSSMHSKYFYIDSISKEQRKEYCNRKNMSEEEFERVVALRYSK